MSESDIADLCRKIYKQHRQAIDLIYEHRPDLRSDIEAYLTQLIQESPESQNLELDSIQGRWIRFAPKEWDELIFQSTCSSGWSTKNRALLSGGMNEIAQKRLFRYQRSQRLIKARNPDAMS